MTQAVPRLFASSDQSERSGMALVKGKKKTKRSFSRDRWLKLLAALLCLLGVAVIAYPFTMQFATSIRQRNEADSSARRVSEWPYPQAKIALEEASKYNKSLAQSGQPVMGEVVDPFGGSKTKSESESERDSTYKSLLDQGEGIMGSVVIPKISVNLPIHHGTSERALASGAGHLYGSSLPVGGKSTHAVLTGHRGMVNALMFTRLDEMRKGYTFYVKTMGKTLGYKVDRILVIEPNDTSKLRIESGVDRVTLMTCTPYGINTHRLLISGKRARIPGQIPAPDKAGYDKRLLLFLLLTLTVLAVLMSSFMAKINNSMIIRHARRRNG